MKPIDAPTSASQPPPSGMFPSLPQPQPTQSAKSNNTSNKFPASTSLTAFTPAPPSSSNVLVNGSTTEEVDHSSLYSEMAAASAITDEELSSFVPAKFSEVQKTEFYTAYRLRSLNKAMGEFFSSVPLGVGISKLIAFYNEKRVEILDRSSLPIPGSKRKTADDEDQENENPSKRSRQDEPSTLPPPQPGRQAAKSPEKVSRDGNQSQPCLSGSSTPKAPSLTPPTFSPSAAPPPSPSPKGKRKAENQLTKDG